MEETLTSKTKRWITAIAAADLPNIAGEIKEYMRSESSTALREKVSLRLLPYLTQAAVKYDKSNVKLGIELSRMADLMFSTIEQVPQVKKFFSYIYHITASLLEMRLYGEAMKICNYMLPAAKLCKADETIGISDMYNPTKSLWHKSCGKLLKSVELSEAKNLELLIGCIKYEFELVKLASDEPSHDIVARMLFYCLTMQNTVDAKIFAKFNDSMANYLKSSEITLKDSRADSTWESICELLPVMIGKDVETAVSRRYFDAFHSSIDQAEKYRVYFDLWESLSRILLKPVANFSAKDLKNMESWRRKSLSSGKGDRSAIKGYYNAISSLLRSVLNYWSEYSKRNPSGKHVTNEMILAIVSLVRDQTNDISNLEQVSCSCEGKNCKMKTATSSELVLLIKCQALVSRNSASLVNEDLRNTVLEIARITRKRLYMLKNANCKLWSNLWAAWGGLVYNMGIICEQMTPNHSIDFYEVFYKSIINFEGLKSKDNLWGLEDPLGIALHRFTVACLKSDLFEPARRATALYALVSYGKASSKAFQDWAKIKMKDPVASPTILETLKSTKYNTPELSLEDYDLQEVCFGEIKGLAGSMVNLSTGIMAVLDETEKLPILNPLKYSQGVQLLGYHLLNFSWEGSIRTYLGKASAMYDRETSPSMEFVSSHAMIRFLAFVDKVPKTSRTPTIAKVSAGLTAGGRNNESADRPDQDVLPAYSNVKIGVTMNMEFRLGRALSKWREYLNSDYRSFAWDDDHTLHAIQIAGEYARLYYFAELEQEAWKLAHKLALEKSNALAIVYVTSRCLTSDCLDTRWIEIADEYVQRLDQEDRDAKRISTMYKLCLAKFYYENDERDEADQLYVEAAVKQEIKFMHDLTNFLIAKDIEMKHLMGNEDRKDDDQMQYTRMMVECLYTLLSLDEAAERIIYGRKELQLLNYEIILDFTNSLAPRMNSLHSYREISAHLIKAFALARDMGNSLRVAECLKILCFIDLSRAKLDDCEVKLQDLEQILEIEAFDQSMMSDLRVTTCDKKKSRAAGRDFDNYQHVDAVRDIGQSDASPVLRKKVFAKPDFVLHGDSCRCFKCLNKQYQLLVFACTYIRAQLFSLQKNSVAAFQHYHGAMKIKKSILDKEFVATESSNREQGYIPSSFQRQQEILDYVGFHIDYCRFLEWAEPELDTDHIMQIAMDAVELCEKYNLGNHPISMSVNEFIIQCRFDKVFGKEHYAKFMVPDTEDMDVSRYESAPVRDPANYTTPAREIIEKRPVSVRRRKTPPFLALDRVPPSDDLDEEKPITRPRRLRRKILMDMDCSDDGDESPERKETTCIPKITLSTSDDANLFNGKGQRNKSVKPVSRPESSSNQPSAMTKTRKTRNSSNNSTKNSQSETQIAEVTELLKGISVETKSNTRSRSRSATKVDDSTDSLQNITNTSSSSSLLKISSADCSTSSVEEVTSGRRGGLRTRSKSTAQIADSSADLLNVALCESSDDEVVVLSSRSARKSKMTTSEQTLSKAKPSRKKTTKIT